MSVSKEKVEFSSVFSSCYSSPYISLTRHTALAGERPHPIAFPVKLPFMPQGTYPRGSSTNFFEILIPRFELRLRLGAAKDRTDVNAIGSGPLKLVLTVAA